MKSAHIFLLLAAVVSFALIVLALQYKPPVKEDQQESQSLQEEQTLTVGPNDPFLGDASAPVTVIEVADIRCPGCKWFFDSVEPSLRSEYIDTGKIKFYFWEDGARFSEESFMASEALLCAHDQEKYWDYRDFLLKERAVGGKAGPTFEAASSDYVAFAEQLGLDKSLFVSCLEGEKYREHIVRRGDEMKAFDPLLYPTIFVNGRRLPDASWREVSRAIEEALEAAGSQ